MWLLHAGHSRDCITLAHLAHVKTASTAFKRLSSIWWSLVLGHWYLIWTSSVSGAGLVGFSMATTRLSLSISREPHIPIAIARFCCSMVLSHVSRTRIKLTRGTPPPSRLRRPADNAAPSTASSTPCCPTHSAFHLIGSDVDAAVS